MTGSQTSRLRVLVVDDCPDTRLALALLLHQWGYECEGAADGEEALRLAGECSPDLLLLDILMPGLDGYEVARRVHQAGGHCPRLVAMTGHAGPGDIQASEEAGFDDYLVKPVEPQQLLALLRTFAADREEDDKARKMTR
jgi:two-component system, OmpR family, response regulator